MKENKMKFGITSLGLCSVVLSMVLVFYIPVYANTCTIIQQCTNAPAVSCTGVAGGCDSTSTSVSCKQNNGTTLVCYCGQPDCTSTGGGNCEGGICPEQPTNP